MNKLLIFSFVLLLFLGSCSEPSTDQPVVMQDDPVSADTVGTTKGVFVGYAHSLQGKALLVEESDGSRTLRFEDFSVTAGPDVYVFLSKANNYSTSNTIEVSKLTSGYNMSNINFSLASINYSDEFKFALVYCVQYNSLFGFAELK